MTVFSSYAGLPESVRKSLLELEMFISEMDGKTVGTPTDGNTFVDEGTVDADDAVKAFNEIVLELTGAPHK